MPHFSLFSVIFAILVGGGVIFIVYNTVCINNETKEMRLASFYDGYQEAAIIVDGTVISQFSETRKQKQRRAITS